MGRAALTRLEDEGHEVFGIRRSAADESDNIFSADAASGHGLERLPQSFDQIIVAISPNGRDDANYERAYPSVARTLSRRFPDARFLLVSSTAVYGQEGGTEISDDSPTSTDSFSAKRIIEAERILLEHNPSSVIVRASGIYGPTRIATVCKLAHVDLTEDERKLWTNRIHRDDLARVLTFLVKSETSGVYLATDPEPATLGTMQDWLRAQPNREYLPTPPNAGRTRSRKSRRMHPLRLLSNGFSFSYPSFRAGYEEILRELRDSKAPA